MTITKTADANELTVNVAGRLDTTTAPGLDEVLKKSLEGVKKLVMDFSELEYISSAGLRVIFSAHKVMNRQGEMVIRGANEDVLEVFEVTGSLDVLTVER